MQSRPTDFTFSRKTLTVTSSDHARFTEGCSDLLDRALRVLRSCLRARRAVDTNHSVLAHAMLIENARDATRLTHSINELRALFNRTHRAVAHSARPHRRNERANSETFRCNRISHLAQRALADIGISVRMKQKEVHAIELLAAHTRLRSEIKHAFERDRRMIRPRFFTNESRPHCVMQFHVVRLSNCWVICSVICSVSCCCAPSAIPHLRSKVA